ncbi:MAG TPA: hypothetical protein VGZ25_10210 [Gemmataceae bacterium]|jgi:hypothetical protein|nr:hypothetical protein [Gemmataceae bacterium]
MKKFIGAALCLVFLATGNFAWSQKSESKQTASSGDKLPIPGHPIPVNFSPWKKVFAIEKVTFDKEDNQLVFLVKAKKNFTFTDDGYDATFEFIDDQGVSLTKGKNLSWEKEPKELRNGEKTRVTLEIPDEETLAKTKKARVVVKGFFNK